MPVNRWALRALATATVVAAVVMPMPTSRHGLANSASPAAAIYVTNGPCGGDLGTVTSYPAGSNGDVAPIAPGLCRPLGVAVDAKGNIYVLEAGFGTVAVYPPGSGSNAVPSATITGGVTAGTFSAAMTVDASGDLYVADGESETIKAYPAGSTGNAAPSSTIMGGPYYAAGIAVDTSGNIYVTNSGQSETTDTIAIYRHGSSGNVAPSATISGPNTGLSYPSGITVDSSGNIYVTNQGSLATPTFPYYQPGIDTITVYPAGSTGNASPSVTIGGSSTGLNLPQAIGLDREGNIYVANVGSLSGGAGTITVYSAGSNGNAVPSATISGSSTGLDFPYGIAVDGAGSIYAANSSGNTVTVYPAASTGNAVPSATIGLSNASVMYPQGVAVDGSGNVYVTNDGSLDCQFGTNGGSNCATDTITVYPAGSNIDIAPSTTIGGSNTGLNLPCGIALDSSGSIYVTNVGNDTVTVYPAGSTGNAAPSAIIGGSNTALSNPVGIAVDPSGNIYVLNYTLGVTVYPPKSNGNVSFTAYIFGNETGLEWPSGIAVDSSGRIYVTNDGSFHNIGGQDTITIYAAGSSGNVAPSATIGGSYTGLSLPAGIAFDAGGNIYVANVGSITVYPAGSTGNAVPSSVIRGPATQLVGSYPGTGTTIGIAVGPGQSSGLTPTQSPTPTGTPTPMPTPTPTPTGTAAPTPTPTLPPVAARISASPLTLNFAALKEGKTSKPQAVTLTNAKNKKQNQTITVLSVSTTGDFAVPAGACVGPLEAGHNCKVPVTFTPSATGARKGSLMVSSNASNPDVTIALSGKGKKPAK